MRVSELMSRDVVTIADTGTCHEVIEQMCRRLQQAPVRAVMSAPVRCITATADLAEAADRMRREKVGCLPVVEGGRVVGMLTEIDVLRSIVGTEAPERPELDIVISYP